mmetsp:Transcript_13612/g.44470  ORF Transcript_13612/g.44470 Transcript_13612/m.44470 type:complete len:204 (+) Transcript_13612:681-1292(+)|eukprot:scaffold6957_cov96-Isochrysis_galbana.AAC.2
MSRSRSVSSRRIITHPAASSDTEADTPHTWETPSERVNRQVKLECHHATSTSSAIERLSSRVGRPGFVPSDSMRSKSPLPWPWQQQLIHGAASSRPISTARLGEAAVEKLPFLSRRDTMMTSVASFQTNSIRFVASCPRSEATTMGKACESFCTMSGYRSLAVTSTTQSMMKHQSVVGLYPRKARPYASLPQEMTSSDQKKQH